MNDNASPPFTILVKQMRGSATVKTPVCKTMQTQAVICQNVDYQGGEEISWNKRKFKDNMIVAQGYILSKVIWQIFAGN